MTTQHSRPGAAPTGQDAAEYPRRILLAVTGLSPQVVTETLFALIQHPQLPFLPTEVHLLTTREGAERARLALLSAEPGWFGRLCRDYRLPEIQFDESCIHVLKSEDGLELDDIRSEQDNQRAADFITETVRAFTSDPDTALHVSIAGGRKTMGFYLGYALSLFGREQDRLSHVLVGEPFESSWDFFYPTPYSRIITTRDNKLADTAKARVTLAEIPFVSLRHGQPEHLLTGHARFSEAVMAARIALGPPALILDLPGRRINAGGRTISLPPAELACSPCSPDAPRPENRSCPLRPKMHRIRPGPSAISRSCGPSPESWPTWMKPNAPWPRAWTAITSRCISPSCARSSSVPWAPRPHLISSTTAAPARAATGSRCRRKPCASPS